MPTLKNLARSIWYRTAQKVFLKETGHPRDYFSTIYRKNLWGGRASKSGLGSEGQFADQKIALLTQLSQTYEIRSIIDLGCGDFNWMRNFTPKLRRYHGVDIVESLIAANQKAFANEKISFQCINLADRHEQPKLTLKKADLVICFDVFGHLLNPELDALLEFILTGLDVNYFLVTNRRGPHTTEYLTRPKTRLEGVDLEAHPLFAKHQPKRLLQSPGVYPQDSFDLYALHAS